MFGFCKAKLLTLNDQTLREQNICFHICTNLIDAVDCWKMSLVTGIKYQM